MTHRMSQSTWKKLQRTKRLVATLPAAERGPWRALLSRAVPQGSYVIAVGAEPPAPENETEWDLRLANWLDGIYQTVADRVEVVAEKTAAAVQTAGFSLWPIVIALGILFIYERGRSAH